MSNRFIFHYSLECCPILSLLTLTWNIFILIYMLESMENDAIEYSKIKLMSETRANNAAVKFQTELQDFNQ